MKILQKTKNTHWYLLRMLHTNFWTRNVHAQFAWLSLQIKPVGTLSTHSLEYMRLQGICESRKQCHESEISWLFAFSKLEWQAPDMGAPDEVGFGLCLCLCPWPCLPSILVVVVVYLRLGVAAFLWVEELEIGWDGEGGYSEWQDMVLFFFFFFLLPSFFFSSFLGYCALICCIACDGRWMES